MSDGSVTDEQAHRWLEAIQEHGWVSLHNASPALGGADRGEISGGGYVRYKMKWSNPANRAIWSLEDARFHGLVQTRVTYFGVWSRGNPGPEDFLRAYAELTRPATILNGKGYILHAGDLAVSFG